jgi:hypothetical protein
MSDRAMQFYLNVAIEENLPFSIYEARMTYWRELYILDKGL